MAIVTRILRVIGLHLLCCVALSLTDDKSTCQAKDFHHVYTECDSEGGRWRVSVPKPDSNCVGGAPNAPVRGKKCQFTCPEGSFLDIDSDDQVCKKCPAGTYSMGGGVRYDDWDHLPGGFTTNAETFSPVVASMLENYGMDMSDSQANCSSTGWKPAGKFISSVASDCMATLKYTANLVKPGEVRFQYQYTDDDAFLHFTAKNAFTRKDAKVHECKNNKETKQAENGVSNSQCQSDGDQDEKTEYPIMTDEGEWKTVVARLKSGVNVLSWKTIGMSGSRKGRPQPIKIAKVEISGIAFTQECTKCPNGTHSDAGAAFCEDCPQDSFALRGASECTKCNTDKQYAPAGSSECMQRPLCTDGDYFDYNTGCDINKKTRVMYNWIHPKICLSDVEGAAELPASGEPVDCPPCNPGMQPRNATCEYCPENEYSDGSAACKPCAASTAAETSLQYKWWQNLPVESNVTITCLSTNHNDGCASKHGWQLSMDHIHSGKGHADDAYLVLSIHIGGFRGSEQVIHGKSAAIAQLAFVFELQCTADCTLFLMRQALSGSTTVIEQWNGQQSKQKYTYKITKTEEVVYTWAFQKQGQMNYLSANQYTLKDDRAIIYAINITNTLGGGASSCKKCPKGATDSGCIPCPSGSYIDPNSTKCLPCPANHIVRSNNQWGIESCIPCGEGLVAAKDGRKCVSDCLYKPEGSEREYDFTALSSPNVVSGTRLFTASGTQYYHLFNISLCGEVAASCSDNISALAAEKKKDKEAVATKTDSKDGTSVTYATICRSTILPPKQGEAGEVLSAQPVSLGDFIVEISNNKTAVGLTDEMLKAEGFELGKDESDEFDIHFQYLSEEPTQACKDGRRTIISLRCDAKEDEAGTVVLPPRCPDGTCDGCSFHFMWRTTAACPVCKPSEFREVVAECVKGEQEVHLIPPAHCVLTANSKDLIKTQKCTVLPLWLEFSIMAIIGVGLLLIVLVIYCWKKNRKLEYKYMKLVTGSGKNGDMELPAADSCGLSEGEEDEQFDAVHFKESKGKNLFQKLKSMRKTQGDGDHLILSSEEEL